MRFRKSIKLLPGVKINLSNSGISTSVGPRGATVNIKPGRRAKLTTSIPGTGLSQSTLIGEHEQAQQQLVVATDSTPKPLWVSVLSGLWSLTKLAAIAVIAIFGIMLAIMTLGGSSKKRK